MQQVRYRQTPPIHSQSQKRGTSYHIESQAASLKKLSKRHTIYPNSPIKPIFMGLRTSLIVTGGMLLRHQQRVFQRTVISHPGVPHLQQNIASNISTSTATTVQLYIRIFIRNLLTDQRSNLIVRYQQRPLKMTGCKLFRCANINPDFFTCDTHRPTCDKKRDN